ncbi:MAG: ribbon-helix-helix domain-containing protein [Thainema sp.]
MAKKLFTTVPDELSERLKVRAEEEGRTVSNLLAYLAERGMEDWTPRNKKAEANN